MTANSELPSSKPLTSDNKLTETAQLSVHAAQQRFQNLNATSMDKMQSRLHHHIASMSTTDRDKANAHLGETNQARMIKRRQAERLATNASSVGTAAVATTSGKQEIKAVLPNFPTAPTPLKKQPLVETPTFQALNSATESFKMLQGKLQTSGQKQGDVFAKLKAMLDTSKNMSTPAHLKTAQENMTSIATDQKAAALDQKSTSEDLTAYFQKHLDSSSQQQQSALDKIAMLQSKMAGLTAPMAAFGSATEKLKNITLNQMQTVKTVEIINTDRKNFPQPLHRGPWNAIHPERTGGAGLEWLERQVEEIRLKQQGVILLRVDRGANLLTDATKIKDMSKSFVEWQDIAYSLHDQSLFVVGNFWNPVAVISQICIAKWTNGSSKVVADKVFNGGEIKYDLFGEEASAAQVVLQTSKMINPKFIHEQTVRVLVLCNLKSVAAIVALNPNTGELDTTFGDNKQGFIALSYPSEASADTATATAPSAALGSAGAPATTNASASTSSLASAAAAESAAHLGQVLRTFMRAELIGVPLGRRDRKVVAMKMLCNSHGIWILCQTLVSGFVVQLTTNGQFQTVEWVPSIEENSVHVMRDIAMVSSNSNNTVTVCGHAIDGFHNSTAFVSTFAMKVPPAGNPPVETNVALMLQEEKTKEQEKERSLEAALVAAQQLNAKLTQADHALTAENTKLNDHGLRVLFPHRYLSKTTSANKKPWTAVVAVTEDGWRLEHTVDAGRVTNMLVQAELQSVPLSGKPFGLGHEDLKKSCVLETADPFYPMRMVSCGPNEMVIVGYSLRDPKTKDSSELCCIRVSNLLAPSLGPTADATVAVRSFTVPGFLYHQTLSGAAYDMHEKVLYVVGYAQTNKTRFSRKGILMMLYLG